MGPVSMRGIARGVPSALGSLTLFSTESFRLLSPGWDPEVQILCYYSYPHTLGGHEGPWGRGLPGAL